MWPDSRLKKVESPMAAMEEALEQIEPADHRDAPWAQLSDKELTVVLDTIDTQAAKLQQQLPHDPVPVDLVRSITSWAQMSSSAGAKVLIIEEAHQLQEGARNAMLKLLEEPPEGLTIIFTTSRRTAVIPTVLSRLRIYNLPERPPEVQQQVQQKIYRVAEPEQPLLQPFFRSSSSEVLGWREVTREIFQALPQPGGVARLQVTLREQLSQGPPRKAAEYLLDALLEELRPALRSSEDSRETAEVAALAEQVRIHGDRISTRNMNPVSVIESLLISMSRVVRGAG
jgi:DNA polymerase-3 subunit gamma/tau